MVSSSQSVSQKRNRRRAVWKLFALRLFARCVCVLFPWQPPHGLSIRNPQGRFPSTRPARARINLKLRRPASRTVSWFSCTRRGRLDERDWQRTVSCRLGCDPRVLFHSFFDPDTRLAMKHSQLAPLPDDLPFRIVSRTIGQGAYAW